MKLVSPVHYENRLLNRKYFTLGMPGDKGFRGTPGIMGAPGLKGYIGEPGSPSYAFAQKGDYGNRGHDGFPGVKGQVGEPGYLGIPGRKVSERWLDRISATSGELT